MRKNTRTTGIADKIVKNLHNLVFFLVSPWLHRTETKPLRRRVDNLESLVYQSLLEREEIFSGAPNSQRQLNIVQLDIESRFNELLENELHRRIEELFKDKNYLLNHIIKPIVDNYIAEVVPQKLYPNLDTREYSRPNKLVQSIENIEELASVVPDLDSQRIACLEGGWLLLARREELARKAVDELWNSENLYIEEFRHNICKYLKLLGSCMENEIQPQLLYQGVINDEHMSVKTYLRVFELMRNKYIDEWEIAAEISTNAAEQLRIYFDYLIDYFLSLLVKNKSIEI